MCGEGAVDPREVGEQRLFSAALEPRAAPSSLLASEARRDQVLGVEETASGAPCHRRRRPLSPTLPPDLSGAQGSLGPLRGAGPGASSPSRL